MSDFTRTVAAAWWVCLVPLAVAPGLALAAGAVSVPAAVVIGAQLATVASAWPSPTRSLAALLVLSAGAGIAGNGPLRPGL